MKYLLLSHNTAWSPSFKVCDWNKVFFYKIYWKQWRSWTCTFRCQLSIQINHINPYQEYKTRQQVSQRATIRRRTMTIKTTIWSFKTRALNRKHLHVPKISAMPCILLTKIRMASQPQSMDVHHPWKKPYHPLKVAMKKLFVSSKLVSWWVWDLVNGPVFFFSLSRKRWRH